MKSIARFGVAEFVGLSRITQSIDPFGERWLIVRERSCLDFSDPRRMVSNSKYFHDAGCPIVHALSQDSEDPGFLHCLSQEMGHPLRRCNTVFREQWCALANS